MGVFCFDLTALYNIPPPLLPPWRHFLWLFHFFVRVCPLVLFFLSKTILGAHYCSQISEDGLSCVFDVPEEHMEGVRHVCENEDWLDICTELPTLKVNIGAGGGSAVALIAMRRPYARDRCPGRCFTTSYHLKRPPVTGVLATHCRLKTSRSSCRSPRYQLILEPAIGQLRKFESPRVRTRINS